MPTMKDVARAADVSVATVSHVINGTRYVSPELSSRVAEAMRALAYTPDGTARSLRVRRTQTLGLVVPDNSNPFFAELARAIEDEAFRHGYTTVLANSNEQPEREQRYVEALLAKRIDGLIVAPARRDTAAVERVVRASHMPVVIVDRDVPVPDTDVVLFDNFGGSYAVVRHLLDLGHRRIACIAGPPDVAPALERLAGFRTAIADADLAAEENLIVESDFHYEGGRAAAAALLDSSVEFTALYALNDLMAAGALRELTVRGLRVPEDVSVVGFDDAPLATMVSPALTTVRQPLGEMAVAAVSALLAPPGDDGRRRPRRTVLPTTLIVRESTSRHASKSVGEQRGASL